MTRFLVTERCTKKRLIPPVGRDYGCPDTYQIRRRLCWTPETTPRMSSLSRSSFTVSYMGCMFGGPNRQYSNADGTLALYFQICSCKLKEAGFADKVMVVGRVTRARNVFHLLTRFSSQCEEVASDGEKSLYRVHSSLNYGGLDFGDELSLLLVLTLSNSFGYTASLARAAKPSSAPSQSAKEGMS